MTCDEHPNAEDWRNRAEAAEQRLAEHLATCDAFPLALALAQAQKQIEALTAKRDSLTERLSAHEP